MSDWNEMKRAYYKSNAVITSSCGTINFSIENFREVVGAEKISYDEYLEIQRQSGKKVRHPFDRCYFAIPISFKGEIGRKNSRKICFKRIYVEGMYFDGQMFEGKEDHVWMDLKGFEQFDTGDSVLFSAEIYRYLKTGNGKIIDYGLKNPEKIKNIEKYELPTDEKLERQAIEQIVCETCILSEQCHGICLLPKGEKKKRVDDLAKY